MNQRQNDLKNKLIEDRKKMFLTLLPILISFWGILIGYLFQEKINNPNADYSVYWYIYLILLLIFIGMTIIVKYIWSVSYK